MTHLAIPQKTTTHRMKKSLKSKHPVLGNSIFLRKLESHSGHSWHCVGTWDEQGSPTLVAPEEQTHFCISLKHPTEASTAVSRLASLFVTGPGGTP